MKKIIYIVCLVSVFFLPKGFAQRDDDADDWYEEQEKQDEKTTKLISIGFGAGGFFASKYVANYYNGSENNVNKISYVLDNGYWYNEIKNETQPYDFELYELPTNMRYKVSTAVNFRAAMRTSDRTSVFFQFNQVNLTATDIFTIELIDATPWVSEPTLMICNIWGGESRTMIDVGFRRLFESDSRWQGYFEMAFNVTNTKVKENKIQIGNFTQSIIDRGAYVPNQAMYDEIPQIGNGIGISGALGLQYNIARNAFFDVGICTHLQDINLEGYKDFNTNFNLFVRLNLLMF